MLNGETSKNTPKRNNLPAKIEDFDFDGFNDFIVPRDGQSRATRAHIEETAKDSFGPEEELVGRLTDGMMAVVESRERIAAEMIALGNQLFHAHHLVRNNMIAKSGDTRAVHNLAAATTYEFFEKALGIKQSAARSYMRCYERFGDNTEAIRIFNVGELDMLAAKHNTDAHINEIMLAKESNPDMTRAEMKKLLDELRQRDNALVDTASQLENVSSLLEDSKTELYLAGKEVAHLKEELAASAREMAAKQDELARLDDLFNRRTAGMSSMEKDIADKDREIERLQRALTNQEPVVEVKEVIKPPAGYTAIAEAVTAKTAELASTEKALGAVKQELESLQQQRSQAKASIDAAEKVQDSLSAATDAFESFTGKISSAQLAMQASSNPSEHRRLVEAISAMLRKSLVEIDTWLSR
jgi:DNA repair exonuclease SbcCD ATPase subunit